MEFLVVLIFLMVFGGGLFAWVMYEDHKEAKGHKSHLKS
jgi:hypothetical protein